MAHSPLKKSDGGGTHADDSGDVGALIGAEHALAAEFHAILDTVRHENASRLLCGTDCKVIDVTLSSGDTNPAHFNRTFRRMTDVTPRQFREQSRLCVAQGRVGEGYVQASPVPA